ncbi:MAG: hypothetical protein HZA34_00330 [Candidatus Pacebacteria bacterium]|nr:hypothetical protein [Candidatus Paceibacterota bacterium]
MLKLLNETVSTLLRLSSLKKEKASDGNPNLEIAKKSSAYQRLKEKFGQVEQISIRKDLTIGDLYDILALYRIAQGISLQSNPPNELYEKLISAKLIPSMEKENLNRFSHQFPSDEERMLPFFSTIIDIQQVSEALAQLFGTEGIELSHLPGGITINPSQKANDVQTFQVSVLERQQNYPDQIKTCADLRTIFAELGLPVNQ